MIKIIKIFFISLVFIFLFSLTYLSILGLETNKFNKIVSDKVKKINPKMDLKLSKIKILIEPFDAKVLLVVKKPQIKIKNKNLDLQEVSTSYNIKSIFKKDFGITNLNFKTEFNDLKDVIKLVRSFKDSPQLLIFDKISKSGKLFINAKLNLNEKGEIKNNYLISGEVKDYSIKLFNNDTIRKINFKFKHTEKNTNLFNIDLDYQNLKISSDNLKLEKKNNKYLVSGNIKNYNSIIDEKLINNHIENINLKNLVFSSDSNFSFEINKKLKLENLNFKSNIDLENAEYYINNSNLEEIFPNFTNKIDIKKNKIYLEYGNNLKISGKGEFFISEKKENIEYSIKNANNSTNFDIKLSLNKTPIKLNLLNFHKKESTESEFNIKFIKNKKNILINNISLSSKKNKFTINGLKLNSNYKIKDFKNVQFNYEDNNNLKNDLNIIKKKNFYLIKGSSFSLNTIIDDILTGDKKRELDLFDKKTRVFKVKFKENNIDEEHNIYNLSGEITLKGSKINKLNLISKFKKDQNLSLSIVNEKNEQVTTFYSDFAKPFVKKFDFIKGFEEGKINFSSTKINNISNSQINIYDFKLQELPALTKLLTLASLQGIADILTGEGVRFDEFEMIFSNSEDLMKIEEIYSLGPAISILMEGYVQKDKLISLKGTLVPATTINKFVSSIPLLGNILVGKKVGEGVFGVSFKIKGPPKNLRTTVNPIKTLTPRFITRTLEKIKKTN